MEKRKYYTSGSNHSNDHASEYSKTHELPHRYLAYRDFERVIGKRTEMIKAIDLGCGAGSSSHFLKTKGFEVIGVDKSPSMVKQAQKSFPEIHFTCLDEIDSLDPCNLVFSSFVLFELKTKEEIISYLKLARSLLRKGGLFLGITGSEHLYNHSRNWMCFDVAFEENKKPLSGDVVKLGLRNPQMVFSDYFWTESDYTSCFKKSSLELVEIHYPLGKKNEAYQWHDEHSFPPFVMFLAENT